MKKIKKTNRSFKFRTNAVRGLLAGTVLGLSVYSVHADLVGVWNFDGATHLEMAAGNAASGDWANLTNGTIFGSGVSFVEDDILGSTVAKFTNAGGISVGTLPLISAGSPDFTYTAYIQSGENTTDVIIGNRYPSVDGGHNFFKLTPKALEYNIAGSTHTSNYELPVGTEWNHVAVRHHGNTLNYYFNGSLVASQNMTVNMKSPVKFGLGGDPTDKTEYWTGQMESFSLYADALTQADLIIQARARLSGMTGYWNAADYTEGTNWVDRINGKISTDAPADLAEGTDKKFEFSRTLNASETAWYADAAKTTHVYDTTGAWNTTAPTVPTTAWHQSGSSTYAAPTAPTGLYIGGANQSAALTITPAQLSSINLTEILRGGSLTTSGGGDFNKTLYLDGGSLNVSGGTFNLTNGGRFVFGPNSTFTSAYMRVGQGDGTAEVVQYGGVATMDRLHIGDNGTNAHGIYTIYSGRLQTEELCVGQYRGFGTMNVQGGCVYSTGLYVANADGVGGEMNITGGNVISNGNFTLANNAGNKSAVLDLSGGNLSVRNQLRIGMNKAGSVNLTGGGLAAREGTILGVNAGGTGTMDIEGGSFGTPSMQVGVTGKGYVSQTGGKASIGTLQLGANRVDGKTTAYDLSGGTLSANAITGANAFTFTGGTLSANSIDASLNQTGGTLEVQKFADGLNWKRYSQTTSNMNDAIWNELDTLTPAAEGVGLIGNSSAVPSATNYMVVSDGYIYIPEDGTYKFHVNSDDHTRTFIDGKSIGDSSWGGSHVYNTLTAALTKGLHKIDIQHRQGTGGQTHNIEIEYPNGERYDINSQGILFSEDNIDIGRMSIAGDYAMSEDSVLNLDVDLSKGIADQLVVSGDVETNGVLNIIFSGELSQDASFQLFDVAGDANFGFSEIHLLGNPYDDSNWDLTGLLAGGDGILRSTGLPEPSTWVLMLAGVSGLYLLRKRRK